MEVLNAENLIKTFNIVDGGDEYITGWPNYCRFDGAN